MRSVLHASATHSQCQVSSRSNLSGMRPVRTKPPDAPLPRELYAALAASLAEIKKQQAERAASASLKDTEIFYLLVFLYRMGLLRTNGRSRSRRFIEFLRGQFPQAPELKREESRIIVP